MGEIDSFEIWEDDVDLEEEEIIETHRMLIAYALGKPVGAVHSRIGE
jgi:hypothetical protein